MLNCLIHNLICGSIVVILSFRNFYKDPFSNLFYILFMTLCKKNAKCHFFLLDQHLSAIVDVETLGSWLGGEATAIEGEPGVGCRHVVGEVDGRDSNGSVGNVVGLENLDLVDDFLGRKAQGARHKECGEVEFPVHRLCFKN